MKYLILVALSILGFAQQPAKSPKGEGISKTTSAEISNQDNKSNQETKPTNSSGPPTLIDQNNSSPQNSDATQADASIRIQGKLVLFTGLLVVVGFLQVGAIAYCFGYVIQSGYSPAETGFYPYLAAPPAYTECT